ncbi:hypothetical protein BDW74DRAFT_179563 [Aspergillus multicolor]|uniref:uncharacterized protein n=1 Tax=Aspergillus multicolor TaxID=41759 RepID=UPI003CCCDBCE
MQSLPPELILLIVEALIPSNPPIFPCDHPVTRTLLSLILTCKLTHHLAQDLLFAHCLYLNSGKRIHDAVTQSSLCKNPPDEQTNQDKETRCRSLYLAFPSAPTLTFRSTDTQIIQLLTTFRTRIHRLVLDLPLRNLVSDNVGGTDDPLRQREITRALSRLEAVEKFCFLRDGLGAAPYRRPWLDTYEIHLWTLQFALPWPRLQRLAMCNPSFDGLFISMLRRCPGLTHLAFTCPVMIEDGYEDSGLESLDVTQTWSHLKRVLIIQGVGPLRTTEWRDFWESRMFMQYSDRRDWERSFLGTLVVAVQNAARSGSGVQFRPKLVYIDEPKTAQFDAEDYATFQEWTGARALDGTLWEYPGLVFDADMHGDTAAAMFADAGSGSRSPVYQLFDD